MHAALRNAALRNTAPLNAEHELFLAVELSTRRGTVALALGDQVLEEALDGGAAHASDLLPAFDRLRAKLGLGRRLPDCLAVGLGPGSFTGLRVAAATALGLARASGAKLVALPSVHATLADCDLSEGGAVLVLDARAGRAYTAAARGSTAQSGSTAQRGTTAPFDAPRAVLWADLEAELQAAIDSPTPPRLFVDEGAARHLAARFGEHLQAAPTPSAARLLQLARAQLAERGPSAASDVRPLYLMDFGT